MFFKYFIKNILMLFLSHCSPKRLVPKLLGKDYNKLFCKILISIFIIILLNYIKINSSMKNCKTSLVLTLTTIKIYTFYIFYYCFIDLIKIITKYMKVKNKVKNKVVNRIFKKWKKTWFQKVENKKSFLKFWISLFIFKFLKITFFFIFWKYGLQLFLFGLNFNTF